MKFRVIIILAIVYAAFAACGDVPVFTELDTNRLKIIIKGTFETESESNFDKMNDITPLNHPSVLTGSVVRFPGANDAFPATFMFDIAELRLNGKKFGNYRQVMEASLSDSSQGPFFNGEGFELTNDDPAEGYYDTVQVYVRKMIFDGGNIYRLSSGTFVHDKETQVIFNEKIRDGGFDFNQYQQNTYVDSLKLDSNSYLRSFPIEIPIVGGLQYDKNEKETVLEIRFVIKNFIKKYELSSHDSGERRLFHFYALSDWLREARSGDRVLGGNILAVARAYVPGKTGSAEVTTPGVKQYVIAIPADGKDSDINDYFMPDRSAIIPTAASGARGFAYDLPQPPVSSGNNIESLLDYYIEYEEYKNDWNSKVPAGANFDDYEKAWDEYDDAVNKFKIAPYVGYTGDSGLTVTFNNMAPGKYKFYRADRASLSYGKLFEGTSPFTQIGGIIEVNIGDNITVGP